MPIKYILLDIEGTISDIHFVKNVLFPYSEKHLKSYVTENADSEKVSEALKLTRETIEAENLSLDEVDQLLAWIKEDRKHPALKSLQGMIWKKGFEGGEFKAPLYEDVLPAIRGWKSEDKSVGIYSSGSVGAQKLFFAHTEHGDVSELFSHHFDLQVGNKKEANSYQKISEQLGLDGSEIAFFSDVQAELDAAAEIGYHTVLIDRTQPTHLKL